MDVSSSPSFMADSSGLIGSIFSSDGFLGKRIDTYIESNALKKDQNVTVGTAYPTGNSNPAAVAAENTSNKQVAAQSNLYLKIGLGAVGLGVVIFLIAKLAK